MDVGTADIIEDAPKPKRKRAGLTGGSNAPNGGGRSPGGGGSDNPYKDDGLDENRFVPSKARILTAFLLLVVLMTFGGLIAAYIVIATNGVAEWQPFALPLPVWISTALILASSVAYHFGKTAIERNDHKETKKWLIITTILGAAFISSQLLAWLALSVRGLYMASNPYAGFFYVMTAVHGIHVLGGIAALGSVLLRSWYPTEDGDLILKRATLAQAVGWYWHLMGILWIVLFILLGFWK